MSLNRLQIKENFNLSVVIPTINSEKFISHNVKKLECFLKNSEELTDYEIILSSQTSNDNTFEVIKNIQSEKISALYLKDKGKGVGLVTLNELMGMAGLFFITIAMAKGPVTLVHALSSVQPFFVLIFVILVTLLVLIYFVFFLNTY